MLFLRQASSSQEILLGPFLDDTDGKTAETGLTIAASDIKLWKEGLTVESNKNSGGATHIAGGRYYAVLDNTDTGTAGKLEINVHVAGALPVRREYMVLTANIYDSLVYGTDLLDVSTTQLAGQTVTAGAGVTFPSSVASPTNITAGTIATVTNLTNLPSIPAGWLTAAGIASGALDNKGNWNIGKSGYTLIQSFPSNFASMSITAGGLVDITQTAADKAWGTTSRVLTAGTNIALAKGTGVTGFNDLDAAGVAAATWNAATATYGSAGSYGLLIETNLDAQVSTVGGGSLTAGAIADAVWDEALSGHATGGSAGAALTGAGSAGDPWSTTLGGYGAGTAGKIVYDNLNATVSSRASQTSVDTVDDFIDTEVAAIKAKTDNLPASFPTNFASMSITAGGLVDITQTAADKAWGTTSRVLTAGTNIALAKGTGITGFNDLDAAGVATAVWNAATATYGSGGSYGALVETNLDAPVSGATAPTAAAVADAVWDEALSGHLTVGSTGEALDNAGSGGGTADWTADEKTVIKAVLGIPGSGTTPADPTTGILDTIRDSAVAIKAKTDALPTDPADASDIAAAFAVTNGKIDVVDDLLDTEIAAIKAETASIQADTNDIQGRLPAALVSGKIDANLGLINNSGTALTAFHRALKGNVIGTVGVGSSTTSIVTSSLLPVGSVADKFKGRLVVFADDTTTVNLRGQATDITANTSAAAPTLTVTALTTAPASGDTFTII